MILQPRSKFGQQILEQYGTEWVLIRRSASTHLTNKPGPWYFIQPLEGDDADTRWIHAHEDPNFEVVSRV